MVEDLKTIAQNVRNEINTHADIVRDNIRSLARDFASFRNGLVIFVCIVWVISLGADYLLISKGNTSNFFMYSTGAMATILGFYFAGRIVTDKNGGGKEK